MLPLDVSPEEVELRANVEVLEVELVRAAELVVIVDVVDVLTVVLLRSLVVDMALVETTDELL